MSSQHPEHEPTTPLGTEPTTPLGAEPTAQLGAEWSTSDDDPALEGEPARTTVADPETRALSISHLVTGLVFLGISGLWLAQEVGAVDGSDMDLLVPLLLVVVGAAGLVAALAKAVRRR
jgi:hypothetical protein